MTIRKLRPGNTFQFPISAFQRFSFHRLRFTGLSQPTIAIHNVKNGSMAGSLAIVTTHCTPLSNVVLQVTTDLTNWTALATNIATINNGTLFYVPKTNSLAFFRIYQ
jgi:hypothetical protein